MNELVLIESKKEIFETNESHYFQIDILKAIMIFLVIFDHMVDWSVKDQIAAEYWERISIPVFLVIMGFNMGLSFKRSGASTLKELYSKTYFKKKIVRYIVPFLVLYIVSTIVGLFIYNFNFTELLNRQYYPHFGPLNLYTGIFLFWGPGSWFIPVILQSILIIPLIYRGFTKKPILTLILCFVIEIVMQVTLFAIVGQPTSSLDYQIIGIFMTSVLFYLPGIGLGIWFSFGYKLTSKRNLFIWILLPISIIFLGIYQFTELRIRIDGILLIRGDYNFLIIAYSAFLVLVALNLLPQKGIGRLAKNISTISKSTYHILLTQIFAFAMMIPFFGTHYSIYAGYDPWDIFDLLFAWAITIPIGVQWYKIDQIRNLKKRLLYYLVLFVCYPLLIYGFYSFASIVSQIS